MQDQVPGDDTPEVEDAEESILLEDEAEGEVTESAEEQDTEPAEAAKPQTPQQTLVFGQYKSIEEAEKGHRELRAWATKNAQELAEAKRQIAALATSKRSTPEIDGKKLTELIADDQGDKAVEAIALRAVEKLEIERATKAQADSEAWRAQKEAEWSRLMAIKPEAERFAGEITGLAQKYPTATLAEIVMALEKEEMTQSEKGKTTDPKRVAENVVKAVNDARRASPTEASGKSGAGDGAPRVSLTRSEIQMAKNFGMNPKDYAEWKTKR